MNTLIPEVKCPDDKAARFIREPGRLVCWAVFGLCFGLSIGSGYSELLCGLLFLSVEEREEERNHGCRDMKIAACEKSYIFSPFSATVMFASMSHPLATSCSPAAM